VGPALPEQAAAARDNGAANRVAAGSTPDALEARARAIDAVLPQTQCTRCGFPDCLAYARAIAAGEAAINQCPPGGAEGIRRLAEVTGLPVAALNPDNGVEAPRTVAWIDENWCIGCTLCITTCPTDAIIGSNKRMHTVIERWCTGCELCIPVCPVDCIVLETASGTRTGWDAWSATQAETARNRYEFHSEKARKNAGYLLERHIKEAETKLADLPAHSHHTDPQVLDRKRQVIEAALARARERKNRTESGG
jgi:electron transport complex protein RnfB